MAGYSGTPLAKKLGIRDGARVALVGAPDGFEQSLDGLPDDAAVSRGLRGTRPFDVIVFFPKNERALRERFGALRDRLSGAGGLWVCWPKKSSGVATHLGDGVVRESGLAGGLVDNKVCAVSDVYSGLRFVRRVRDR